MIHLFALFYTFVVDTRNPQVRVLAIRFRRKVCFHKSNYTIKNNSYFMYATISLRFPVYININNLYNVLRLRFTKTFSLKILGLNTREKPTTNCFLMERRNSLINSV